MVQPESLPDNLQRTNRQVRRVMTAGMFGLIAAAFLVGGVVVGEVQMVILGTILAPSPVCFWRGLAGSPSVAGSRWILAGLGCVVVAGVLFHSWWS
jgi:hypothetical protein